MKFHTPAMMALLATTVAAQGNLFSSLLSEAGSIFTEVTSALGGSNSATSSSSAATTSSTTSSSSTTDTSSSSSSASAAATSSLSTVSSTSSTSASSTSSNTSSTSSGTSSASSTGSRSSSAAAQGATTSPTASSSGGSSNILPIVLGCTLGALALAALLALFFFCRRRKRRNNTVAAKHRPLSASDEDIDGWRHEKPYVRSSKGPIETTTPMGTHVSGAPLMSEYSQSGHTHEPHQNPFTPAPPPARRSNSRAGLHGPAYYSAQPFSADDYHPQNGDVHDGSLGHTTDQHHNSHPVAAGVGGLALGGLAAHAVHDHEQKKSRDHDRDVLDTNRNSGLSEAKHNNLPESIHRRSGSVSRASAKEPWPFMDAHERKSTESGRSRARSFSRSRDRFTTPDSEPPHTSTMPSAGKLAGAAAVGSLAGATIAHKSKSKSPRRKSILKQTTSDSSDPVSISSDSRKSMDNSGFTEKKDFAEGPHELAAADIPPAPTTRERRNSAFGTAAPPAAIGSYVDEKSLETPPSRRSGGGNVEHEPMPPLPLVIPNGLSRSSADLTAPAIPNRSPRRRSLTPNARYSIASEGTAEMPGHSVERAVVSPPLEAQRYSENGGLVSPVSPINRSHSGSWSRAHAEELGMAAAAGGVAAETAGRNRFSQESTAVVTPETHSDNSAEQSSGLVSAIQKIFGAQRAAWPDHNDVESVPTYRRVPVDMTQSYENPVQSIPHRKPAPKTNMMPPNSYRGDFHQDNTGSGAVPGAWNQSTPERRSSNESQRSFPFRSRSRGNSFTRGSPQPVSQAAITQSTRQRTHSRPGYGWGSGDPFDLATRRTDSNMTGLSLSNYQTPPTHPHIQPAYQRPAFSKRESSSSDYREPTLAELRQQVVEDDKVMARQQWRRSRSISAGRRHGNDAELFDLAMPDQENLPFERERIYGPETAKKRSLEQERSSRYSNSNNGSVGWAY